MDVFGVATGFGLSDGFRQIPSATELFRYALEHTKMRICLLPLRFEPKNPLATIRHLDDVLESIWEHEPDLVCLPELFSTGYIWEKDVGFACILLEDLTRFGEPIPGPSTSRISRIANDHQVFFAFGLVEKSGPEFFNSSVLVSRMGEIVLKHRKIQESAPYTRGVAVPSADTEVGRISMLICGDLVSEEAAGMLDGAVDLLITISAGTYQGRYEEFVARYRKEEAFKPMSHREAIGRLAVRTGYVSILEPELPFEDRFFGVGTVIDEKGCIIAQSSCVADEPLLWDL